MAVTLTSAAVSVMDMQTAVKTLLHEFLAHFFDGTAHTLAGAASAVEFPKAAIVFDRGGNEQPMDAPEIRVILQPTVSEQYQKEDKREIFEGVMVVFAVRMTAKDETGKHLAGQVADRLYGLLQHKGEVVALARKGIHNVTVRPPRAVDDPDFHRHLLVATVRLIVEAAI